MTSSVAVKCVSHSATVNRLNKSGHVSGHVGWYYPDSGVYVPSSVLPSLLLKYFTLSSPKKVISYAGRRPAKVSGGSKTVSNIYLDQQTRNIKVPSDYIPVNYSYPLWKFLAISYFSPLMNMRIIKYS